MSRRHHRNHTPAFKAWVALEGIQGKHTLTEAGQRDDVHPNQIVQWRKQLLECVTDIFDSQGRV